MMAGLACAPDAGYFLSDFNQALDFITAMDTPHLKLQFDVYHRQILHGDVIKGVESRSPLDRPHPDRFCT